MEEGFWVGIAAIATVGATLIMLITFYYGLKKDNRKSLEDTIGKRMDELDKRKDIEKNIELLQRDLLHLNDRISGLEKELDEGKNEQKELLNDLRNALEQLREKLEDNIKQLHDKLETALNLTHRRIDNLNE
jgi:peptidoglycan hydrolase CwlO-like protein